MKFIRYIASVIFGGHRRQAMEQLQWQRYLLHAGIPATAVVLDITTKPSDVPEYAVVYMWLKLKYQDKVSVHRTGTYIRLSKLPQKDEQIHIKFLPENMQQVLVL